MSMSSQTNANDVPRRSCPRFDFETFDSEITRELKENSMFYDPIKDERKPGEIGAVIALPSVELSVLDEE